MTYRHLGRSGLKVSVLSFGSWVSFGGQMDIEKAEACMVEAYDAGVNFFDNAEAYAAGKSEEIMGEVIKRQGWPRHSYVISSKYFWGM
ncbi:MAG: aldo/keto reductase, partial [Acidimicrobiia bacterium]|nr:aldo/keto reductase [Acidimicrobiia bacterium]